MTEDEEILTPPTGTLTHHRSLESPHHGEVGVACWEMNDSETFLLRNKSKKRKESVTHVPLHPHPPSLQQVSDAEIQAVHVFTGVCTVDQVYPGIGSAPTSPEKGVGSLALSIEQVKKRCC